MIDIMEKLWRCVTLEVSTDTVVTNNDMVWKEDSKCHQLLIGSNQLSVALARVSAELRINSDELTGRLQALVSTVEGLHTTVTTSCKYVAICNATLIID